MDAATIDSIGSATLSINNGQSQSKSHSHSRSHLNSGNGSSSSSNSSGYGSATTTPTNPASVGSTSSNNSSSGSSHNQYDTHSSSTPVGLVEPTPVATVAPCTPYINESYQQVQQQQQQQQQQNQHQFQMQQQQQHHQFQQQLPQSHPQHQHPQHQQQHQQYHQSHAYPITAQPQPQSLSQYGAYNSAYSAPSNFQHSTVANISSAAERNIVGVRHTSALYSTTEKLPANAKLCSTSAQNHSVTTAVDVVIGSDVYSKSAASAESGHTSKPQAAATPFYAQPLHAPNAVASTMNYVDPYRHKLPAKLTSHGMEYSNYGSHFVETITGAFAPLQHQQPQPQPQQQQQPYQQYHAANKPLSESAYAGMPLKSHNVTGSARSSQPNTIYAVNSAATNNGSVNSAYYDKYDKYLYTPPPATSGNTGLATLPLPSPATYPSPTAAAPAPIIPPQYTDLSTDTYRKTSSWHWTIDYPGGNCRTLPPPGSIPTATVPPTNTASYLPQSATTRDLYYTHEKFTNKYDKYNSYYHHQQYLPGAASRSAWPNTHPHSHPHTHLAPAINERLSHPHPTHSTLTHGMPSAAGGNIAHPHPTLAYHYPPVTSNAAVVSASRQNCCSQPYQQQNYFPRGSHLLTNAYGPQAQPVSYAPVGSSNISNPNAKYPMLDYSHHATKSTKGTNDLYATAPVYEAPTHLSHYYPTTAIATASNQQQYVNTASANTASHPSINASIHSGFSSTYYNDLSLQAPYDTYGGGMQPSAAHRAEPMPSYSPNHAKASLLDYRKPLASSTNADCYLSEPTLTNLDDHVVTTGSNYENFGPVHNLSGNNSTLYSKSHSTDSTESTESAEKSGATKNYANLRDFLSTWNEDEEDYGSTDDIKFVENEMQQVEPMPKLEAEIAGVDTMPVNNYIQENLPMLPVPQPSAVTHEPYADPMPQVPPATKPLPQVPQQPQQLMENHLQFKGSFNTRPKIHVGITVDSTMDVDANQYINLPDIIIDIEKSNNVAPTLPTVKGSTEVEADLKDMKSIEFGTFDVEKELDELQTKKVQYVSEGPQTRIESVIIKRETEQKLEHKLDNATQVGDTQIMNASVDSTNRYNVVMEQQTDIKTELDSDGGVELINLSATVQASNQCGSYNTDPQTTRIESDSASNSNSSTFEKEYETFINKIGTKTETEFSQINLNSSNKSTENTTITPADKLMMCVDPPLNNRQNSESDYEFSQKIKSFSKFYKRKRKYSDNELENQSKKIKTLTKCATETDKNTNFPRVYTKNCRKRLSIDCNNKNRELQKLGKNFRRYSFYSRTLHTLRRFYICKEKINNTELLAKHISTLKERHLPLIKRQSIKQYASAEAGLRYEPKSLKCLSVSFVNTQKFRDDLLKNMYTTIVPEVLSRQKDIENFELENVNTSDMPELVRQANKIPQDDTKSTFPGCNDYADNSNVDEKITNLSQFTRMSTVIKQNSEIDSKNELLQNSESEANNLEPETSLLKDRSPKIDGDFRSGTRSVHQCKSFVNIIESTVAENNIMCEKVALKSLEKGENETEQTTDNIIENRSDAVALVASMHSYEESVNESKEVLSTSRKPVQDIESAAESVISISKPEDPLPKEASCDSTTENVTTLERHVTNEKITINAEHDIEGVQTTISVRKFSNPTIFQDNIDVSNNKCETHTEVDAMSSPIQILNDTTLQNSKIYTNISPKTSDIALYNTNKKSEENKATDLISIISGNFDISRINEQSVKACDEMSKIEEVESFISTNIEKSPKMEPSQNISQIACDQNENYNTSPINLIASPKIQHSGKVLENTPELGEFSDGIPKHFIEPYEEKHSPKTFQNANQNQDAPKNAMNITLEHLEETLKPMHSPKTPETIFESEESSSSSTDSSSTSSSSDSDSSSTSTSSSCSDEEVDDDDNDSSNATDKSDFNEMEELERELSQHKTKEHFEVSKTDNEINTGEKNKQDDLVKNIDNNNIKVNNDIENLKKMLESDSDEHEDCKNVSPKIIHEAIVSQSNCNISEDIEQVVADANRSSLDESNDIRINNDKLDDYVESIDNKTETEFGTQSITEMEAQNETKIGTDIITKQNFKPVPSLKSLVQSFMDANASNIAQINVEILSQQCTSENLLCTIPKLSALCKIALSSSFDTSTHSTTLDTMEERELSVEEALAEMYRQAGVFSDPEDTESDEKENQDVLLINLEEILVDDSNDLYVLQCDMDENVLSVVAHNQGGMDEPNVVLATDGEEINTLEVSNETAMKENEVFSAQYIEDVDLTMLDVSETTVITTNDNQIQIICENNATDEALSSQDDLLMIHHEEIVPDNYRRFRRQILYNRLREKYVLKRNNFRTSPGQRVLKKYIHRWIVQIVIAYLIERETNKVKNVKSKSECKRKKVKRCSKKVEKLEILRRDCTTSGKDEKDEKKCIRKGAKDVCKEIITIAEAQKIKTAPQGTENYAQRREDTKMKEKKDKIKEKEVNRIKKRTQELKKKVETTVKATTETNEKFICTENKKMGHKEGDISVESIADINRTVKEPKAKVTAQGQVRMMIGKEMTKTKLPTTSDASSTTLYEIDIEAEIAARIDAKIEEERRAALNAAYIGGPSVTTGNIFNGNDYKTMKPTDLIAFGAQITRNIGGKNNVKPEQNNGESNEIALQEANSPIYISSSNDSDFEGLDSELEVLEKPLKPMRRICGSANEERCAERTFE